MAVSRPVLLALLGAILALALFYATIGSRESTDEPTPPAAPEKGAKAKTPSKAGPKAKGRAPATAARPPRTKPKPAAAAPTGVPADVTRALARKRTVVLFFFQRGSADDDFTARSVASLRGRRGVEVFSAPISRLADYRGVTAGAGVSQAPAVVVVGSNGTARLIEGLVDAETLSQEVADSR